MIRRFTIPRFVWWHTALVLFSVGGIFALWSAHVWTPVQRHYLWTYLWCSRPGAAPSAQSAVRWIWKTSPEKKPELAANEDAVSSAGNGRSELAMVVSSAARQVGWTGLMLGPKERFPIATLKPFLQEQFFDGTSVWRVLAMPFLWGWPCAVFWLSA